PSTQGDIVRALAGRGVTAFSLELLPRISRAQSMDALSSQASAAGYKAVLMAAARIGKLFPMMMTAAGTVAPTRVLVMGAGVAGLQAIATARRLGAVVFAYDVRPRRTYGGGQGGRCRRLDHHRHTQHPVHHAVDHEPALRAQRRQPASPSRQGRRHRARFRGRDHQRRVRDPWWRDRQRAGEADGGGGMTNELLNELTFFVLAICVGFEVISKVPTILHTPLMSGTNAIHGIILVGAILIAAGA